MHRNPERGKGNDSGDGGGLLNEIEALSQALAIVEKPAGSRRRHSLSVVGSYDTRRKFEGSKNDLLPPPAMAKRPSPSSSSSIWKWKPLRALSHMRHRKFDCRFSLQIHSAEGIPSIFDNSRMCVHWRRDGEEIGLRTCPALVSHGAAEFEEILEDRCTVYGSKGGGSRHAVKYQAKPYVLFAAVVGAPGFDLGEHRIDLTRLLPLTVEELEKERSSRWSTTFKLSGQARGALLHVSFGFSLLDGEDLPEPREIGRADDQPLGGDEWISGLRRGESLPVPNHEPRGRLFLPPQAVDDVKVLHEILPAAKIVQEGADQVEEFSADGIFTDCSKFKLKALPQQDESPRFSNTDASSAAGKMGIEEELPDPEFTVIDKGIECVAKDVIDTPDNLEPQDEAKRQQHPLESENSLSEFHVVEDELKVPELSHSECTAPAPPSEPDYDEFCSALQNLSIFGPADREVWKPDHLYEMESSCSTGKAGRSLSLDDETESAASEFLRDLEQQNSSLSALSSDSDPESPKARLWRQFREESLAEREKNIFDLGLGKEKETGLMNFDDDFDLSFMGKTAEELQKECQSIKSRRRAKMLDDAEAEALMRELGLNERAFQHTPPGSPTGFGSPIELPPDDRLLDLPRLDDGLLARMNDEGFWQSMDPSIFRVAHEAERGGAGDLGFP